MAVFSLFVLRPIITDWCFAATGQAIKDCSSHLLRECNTRIFFIGALLCHSICRNPATKLDQAGSVNCIHNLMFLTLWPWDR